MASLIKTASLYTGAAAINTAVPLLALPILIRALGPDEFGKVGVYLALVNVAVVLVGLSVHGIVSVVHFRDGTQAVAAYVRGALRIAMLTAIPLALALCILAPLFERTSGLPGQWAWTIALIAAAQFMVMLGLAVFQAREQPLRYAALQIGVMLGWAVLAILLIYGLGLDWTGWAVGRLVASAVGALVVLYFMKREGMLLKTVGTAPLSSLLHFGLPLVPHALSGAVMGGADRLLLAHIGGAEMTGMYYAAFQICSVITLGAAAINQAWVPWLYRRLASPSRKSAREIVRVTFILYGVFLFAALIFAGTAPWLVQIIAGERYLASVSLIRWLAPAAAFSGMYYFVTNYLFYHGRTGILSMVTVSTAILQIGLLVVCVPRWGITGAAFAALVTATLYWAAIWYAAQKIAPMPWFAFFRRELMV